LSGAREELRLLSNRWERALEGEAQVALIIGEAGIGKSRLVQRFHEEIKSTPHTWVEADSAPFFQNTPFHPVIDILQQRLRWHSDESPEERIAGLESVLEPAGLKLEEAVPLIAPLLNVPVSSKYPPLLMGPDLQRKRLLATLAAWVFGTARLRPLVIVTEDLHWIDPSTLELIQLLVEQGTTSQLMLVYTARPEFRPSWPLRAHHAQLTLNRLSARNVREMVARVSALHALPDETVARVIERTGGVPLFVEELTRAVLESGGPNVAREIPATLHDSLMARLDRLGSAKEVAQVAAVMGREFSYELLSAVMAANENDLQQALNKLADAELIYQRGIPPNATYTFKHALIQDAAYEALLKSRRREMHRRVAQAISDRFPAIAESEVLARHWREAGEAELAIAAWQRAGERAVERRAFREAEELYRQAIAMLATLAESPARDARE
jgi:predicted ATPase